jgi:hypothetical protein
MTTRAQRARAEQQRTGRVPPKHPIKPDQPPPRYSHNDAPRAERRSSYAIEPGPPSRKSTRDSANRAKPDSAQRLTANERMRTPSARAQRKDH